MPVGEWAAAGFHSTAGVIAHSFELPDSTNALEVADVGAVGQVHAIDVGVARGKCEVDHKSILRFKGVYSGLRRKHCVGSY